MPLPEFELRITLGSLVTAGSVLGAAWAILHYLSKISAPFIMAYRQHLTLIEDYNIRTEEDGDVHRDPKTGMKKPSDVYRKRAEKGK